MPLTIAGRTFKSRLFAGTGRFQSPALLRAALAASGTEMVTVAIRTTGVDGSGPDAGILSAIDLDEVSSSAQHSRSYERAPSGLHG